MIVRSVTPFTGETAATQFFDGTIAIVRAGSPSGLIQEQMLTHLASENEQPVELRFFTNSGLSAEFTF
ncbi:MAG: hypothetical protein K2O12_03780 [Muribaculaceae bacterium]|nr:hypothetical protein [Muribaculaceae bacterium]